MKLNRRKFIVGTSVFTIAGLVHPAIAKSVVRVPQLKFGLVTDSHYANRPSVGNRYYNDSLIKIRECISVFNEEKVNFIIHLGDFKDQGIVPSETETLEYLKSIESEFNKFSGAYYHAIGNHDVDSITKNQFLDNIVNAGISPNKNFYSFDNGNYHFVVLDANYDMNGNDHYFKEGSNWQDANIPSFELSWLSKDLSKTIKPTIVFLHHPLYEYFICEHKYHVSNSKEVREVLEKQGNVLAVFQGHVHEESLKTINNIRYFTQLGMVDFSGLDNNCFSIVKLYSDKIVIDGYKRASDFQVSLS